jgi:hypothetical protein
MPERHAGEQQAEYAIPDSRHWMRTHSGRYSFQSLAFIRGRADIRQNGGHMQPLLYSNPKEIAAFELKNTSEVRSYIEQHEIECEFREVQICHAFWTDSFAPSVKKSLDEVRRESPEYFKLLQYIDSAQDLEQIKVQPGCKCAVKNYGAASLSPYKYVSWIVRKLIQSGQLNLQTNTPVLSISEINNNEALFHRLGILSSRPEAPSAPVTFCWLATRIHLTCSQNSRT